MSSMDLKRSGSTSTSRESMASVIFNLCSAPRSELERLHPSGPDACVFSRRDLSPGKLYQTLLRLPRRKARRLEFYCGDVDRQHNLFALKSIAILMGARTVALADATGKACSTTRMRFLLKDVPLALATSIYVIVTCLAFGLLSVVLLVIPRRARNRSERVGSLKALCYLKTDFWFGLKAGGSVTHTREFIKASVHSGYRTIVIAADTLESYGLPVEVRVIPPARRLFDFPQAISKIEYNFRFPIRAIAAIQRMRPAFLYQRCSQNNFSGVLLSMLTGIPLVLEYNSSSRLAGLSRRRSRWSLVENLCDHINLRRADVIAVVSQELRSRLVRAGIAPDRIIVNPNGVDPERFSERVDSSPVKATLPANKAFVGFIGIFEKWHGVLTLAESVKYAVEQEARVHFLIIGDGELKNEMVSILRQNGVTSAATFVGIVAYDEAPKYLNACDVLVSPHEDMSDGSVFFGSPTKIFEYMAMGKGIVASRVGQLGDILENGRSALLVEQKDPRALAEAIVELIRNAGKRMELGMQARKKAVEMYTWQHNFRRIVDSLGL
jgi:glycosyltransferase involved in cell wall biosynthesis